MATKANRSAYQKEYARRNSEKKRRATAVWKENNPGRFRQWCKANPDRIRAANIKCKYGITVEQYRTMFDEQLGLCKICHSSAGEKSLHIDHCHETGIVRGLLCSSCNLKLGVLEQREWVSKALNYLEGK